MITNLDNRKTERISLGISVIVKSKLNKEDFWKETSELISVSQMGAGFYLKRECQIGQLLSLLIPMPKHLRQYDEAKEQYRIWGVVQHCNKLGNDEEYHTGVAFIGKKPPASYYENPLQSYRIVGMNSEGLWNVLEIVGRSFVNRKHPRFWITLEVEVSGTNTDSQDISDLFAKTENISASGASVFSHLKLDVGDSILFNCKELEFSSKAIIRNRQAEDDLTSKLHLEFLDASFPVEKLTLQFEDSNEN